MGTSAARPGVYRRPQTEKERVSGRVVVSELGTWERWCSAFGLVES